MSIPQFHPANAAQRRPDTRPALTLTTVEEHQSVLVTIEVLTDQASDPDTRCFRRYVSSTEIETVLGWARSEGFVDTPQSSDTPTGHLRRCEFESLTARESEVLALIADGVSNSEIASRLYLGMNTVKTYIRSAYRKIGVTTRSQAILWAIDRGLRHPIEQ